MPLIDEQTRATDRRPPNRSLMIAVGLAVCAAWALVSLAVSLAHRETERARARGPLVALQNLNAMHVRQAQSMAGYGGWPTALTELQVVNPGLLSTSDKHAYFRTYAQALLKTGSPLAGAQYYDRFLSMSSRLYSAECRSCHPATGPGVFPTTLLDMKKSKLGPAYASALQSAGKLKPTRDALHAKWKQRPDDPRLNLLLYHLEKALKDAKVAEIHAARLQAFDDKQSQ